MISTLRDSVAAGSATAEEFPEGGAKAMITGRNRNAVDAAASGSGGGTLGVPASLAGIAGTDRW